MKRWLGRGKVVDTPHHSGREPSGPQPASVGPALFREQALGFQALFVLMCAVATAATIWMVLPTDDGWWPPGVRPDVVIAMVVLLGAGAVPAIWKGLAGSTNDTITIQEAFAAPLAAIAGPAIAGVAVHCVTFLVGRLPGERARLWWRRVEHQSGRYLEFAAAWLTWRSLKGQLEPAVVVALGTAAATTVSWLTGLGSRITQRKTPRRETWMPLFREYGHQIVWLPGLAAMTMLLAEHGWAAVLLVLSPISVFHISVSRDAKRFAAESRVDIDQLTMLPGRGRFYGRLSAELARARITDQPLALIILDLDDFKKLNDTEGHLAGDECLKQVSSALSGAFREHDTVYRYGGEEFALILPGAGLSAARRAGERARRAVASIQRPQPVTASVGVSCFPSDAEDARELVDAADRGLYKAKRGGKNRVRNGHGLAEHSRTGDRRAQSAIAASDGGVSHTATAPRRRSQTNI